MAFDEVDRLESLLSYFIPSSDVARFNDRPGDLPLKVGLEFLECLKIAREIHRDTRGAFDPFIGCQLSGRRYWDASQVEATEAKNETKKILVTNAFDRLDVNADRLELTKTDDNLEIDLGGIAKGYAIDRSTAILADLGYTNVLLHSGQSTFLPITRKGAAERWTMRLLDPESEKDVLGSFVLWDRALSCSAQGDRPHILDPVSGRAVNNYKAVWVTATTAVQADALSTAFMVMPFRAIEAYCREQSEVAAILLPWADPASFQAIGDWDRFSLSLSAS